MLVLGYHTAAVNSVAFSGDARWLASGGDDGDIWITDVSLTLGCQRLAWGAKYVFSVDLSVDGTRLAVGTDSSLVLLQQMGHDWTPLFQRKDHRGWVAAVAFDPTGEFLASGGIDGQVRLWDATRRRRRPLRILISAIGPIRSVRFSPDGRFVAAAGVAGLAMWHPLRPEPCFVHRFRDADARSLAFGHDGQSLWVVTNRAVLQLDTATGDFVPINEGTVNRFRCLQASPVEQVVLVGRDDGLIQRHDGDQFPDSPATLPLCHQGAVNAIAIHPEGEVVATAGDDGTIRLWPLGPGGLESEEEVAFDQCPGLPIHQFRM